MEQQFFIKIFNTIQILIFKSKTIVYLNLFSFQNLFESYVFLRQFFIQQNNISKKNSQLESTMAKRTKAAPTIFNNYGIYLLFGIVIALLTIFCIQLKTENQDKQIHVAKLNLKENTLVKQPIKQRVVTDNRLNQQIVEAKNVILVNTKIDQIQLKKPFDGYIFSTIQDWGNKKAIQQQFNNQQIRNKSPGYGKNLRPDQSRSRNYPTRSPQLTKAGTTTNSIPYNQMQPQQQKQILRKPTVTAPRAGITLQQIGLAKRLQKLKNLPSNTQQAIEQKAYYQEKYNISQYQELPFCIVIPSYNNQAQNRYINNINSILQQQYSNYHIIFLDDASDDGTGKLMKKYAFQHQISQQKLKIIINENRTMAMPNIYRAAKEFCKPYELFLIIDGDDQLIGRQVLKHFNSLFQTKDIWVAYTNFLSIRGSVGYSRPYSSTVIQKNAYRRSGFVISHLRIFYTKLLTLINQQDLKDEEGKWFRAANDVAMYMPILQMSHRRITYCPQISYLYNSNTGLNNHKSKLKQQKSNEKKIKAKSPYKDIEQLLTPEEKQELKNNMNKKIQIKNTKIPAVPTEVKKQGWQM